MNTDGPSTPHMPPRRNWWRTFVLTGVIFFSGIVVGATIGSFAMWSHGGNENRESRFREERFMRHVERQFDLDQEQRQQIRAIVKRHHKELKEIRQETEPRVREIFESMRNEIGAVMTPDDLVQWMHHFERMERFWLGPRPPRNRPHRRGDRPPHRTPNLREIFQDADRDRNGVLSLDEYTEAFPNEEDFYLIDQNRDGMAPMEEAQSVFRRRPDWRPPSERDAH